MNKKKRVLFWIVGGAGILVLLFLALLLLAPWIIDSEPVKKRMESFISQKIEGKIEFQRVELSFFPRPVAGMDQVRISIPGTLKGTIGALRIYPELMPLLKGEVRISKFQIEAPDVSLSLPEKRGEERSAPPTLQTVQDKVASLLSALESNVPGLRAEITKGSLELSEAGQPVFSFRNIEGQFALPPGALQIDLSCSSNLCERFSLKGSLDPKGFKGEGSVRVDGFLPHVLSAYIFPDAPSPVGESKVNMNVGFKMNGPGALQAELEASAPYLTLQRGKAKQIIKARSIQATLSLDDEKTMVSLTRLSLDVPKLDLAGKFVMDRKTSRVSLELEGWDLNLTPLREAALSIAGDVPVIQEICAVVRGGNVPRVLFQTQGSSMADLGATENILVKAGLRDGRITISGPALDLEQVNGEAVISRGILKGEGLEARLGKSRGQKGTMTLGLEGKDAPFNLDVPVQADLAEVASLLKRLVKNKPFQNEISRISSLKGSAVGKLALGKSLSSINVRAEVSGFRLSARYGPLPYPIEITQGQFAYDEFKDTVRVQNLGGKLGTSSFSGMTAQLSPGKVPSLEVLSGKLLVRLDEIYPWLASFQGVGNHLKDISSVKGFLDVSQIRLQGPPSKPESWHFDATGEVRDVSVNASLFKDPIRVTRGKFNVTPQKLSFTDVQGQLLDASLRVSGALTQFLAGPLKTDVTLSGKVGAEATRWISKVAKLPADPTIRPPFSISQAHLTLEGKGATKTSLQGKLTFENGPDVSMDVLVTPQELVIRDLSIQDKMSRATFAITLGKNLLNLKFAGELNGKTLDRMLLGSELPAQWMKGNLQARIRLDQPWLSTADGKMEGRDIHVTLKQIGHLEINQVSLEAAKSNVRVNSAAFRWLNQPFSLNGVANVSPKGIEFDMDLSAKTVEFDTVRQVLLGKGEKGEVKSTSPSGTPPVKGTLRLKTDRFTYGNFTWMPLYADVSFGKEGVSVQNIRGSVCGLSTPGSLTISDQGIEMEARPTAVNQELESSILCLSDKKTDIKGTFSLNGQVRSKGKSEGILRSLQGDIRFTARDGQILYHSILARVFTFLNVTEVLRGKLPDFSQGGLLYDTITIDGDIREGNLVLKEFIIDGRTVSIIAGGKLDLFSQTLDLKLLVAPFKTVDAIVKIIPLVGYILGGSLISVPVRVSGDLRDPNVTVLSPSAIGSELLAPMGRILKLPFKVIDPFLPSQKTK
ncbi:MAG: AsmA-like C-terminal domain-containing protein [Deltaproteobacteria bacterium]